MLKDVLYSVTLNKCPKCHEGKVFTSNSAYNLKTFDKMNAKCSCCGEVFEKEPGYFYGAMYVSYALMVAWLAACWAFDLLFIHSDLKWFLTFVVGTMALLMPITYRVSRLVWLNFFVKFDKEKNKQIITS
jgi:uncharacterized protein (DUF983 family)